MRSRAAELVLGRLGSAVAQALLLVVLARLIPLDSFGLFGLSSAVGAIVGGVLGFGLPTRVLVKNRETSVQFASSSILLGVLLGLTTGISTTIVSGVLTSGLVLAIVAGAALAGSEVAVNIGQNYLFGVESLRRASAVMVIRRLVPLISVLVTMWATPDWIFLGLTVGALVATVVCLFLTGVRMTALDRITARSLLRESRHYWITNIGSMAQQLDVVIVGSFAGASAAAIFTSAFRLASPVHIVTGLITARAMPVVSRNLETDAKNIGARPFLLVSIAYSGAILLALPLLATLAVLILGPPFSQWWWVFFVLFANGALSVLNQVFSSIVFALQYRPHLVGWATWVSTAAGLGVVVIGAVAGDILLAASGTLLIQGLLLIATSALLFAGIKSRRAR